MGTTLGTTISLSTGSFFVSYQITLGQVLLACILMAILVTMLLRWFGEWMYR